MAMNKAQLEAEATRQLMEQAKIRSEMSGSLEGYLNTLKQIKEVNDTIKFNDKVIKELKDKQVHLTGEDLRLNKIKINVLKKQNKVLNENLEVTKENLKTVKTTNLVLAKMGSSAVKGLGKLPGLLQNSFGKLKGYGLFDMDKAVKMSALQMGLLGKEGKSYALSIRDTAVQTNLMGVGIEELAKMQGQYTEDLGRSVMLGDKGLKSMAAMSVATGLGAEGAGDLAVNMEEIGMSAERTGDYINQTMNDSHKMGLNASKVVKNISSNIKMLNKYHFKDGIRGLAKMSELTTKLGIKMDFAAGMSDKLWDIEGAVDMSAQLQVMGGAWAKMADPFHLMYMAREDMAGLTKEIAEASQESMHFAKDGSIEMSSMAMSKLKIIAQQTGLEYDDLVKSGKEMFKMNKVKQQIGFNFTEEQKEFIANTAQMTENGKATIEIDGSTKFVSQMTAGDQAWLQMQVSEKKSMAERAKASRNFDDQLTDLINQFKTYMLPIIDGINETLGPVLTDFMTDPDWQKDLLELGKDIGSMIKSLGPVIKTIADLVIGLGPKGTLAVYLGGKFLLSAAKWLLNGVALGQGFLATTKGAGLLGATGKGAAGKGGGMGALGKAGLYGAAGYGVGMATDWGSEKAKKAGNEDLGKGIGVLGKSAEYALYGAAIGSLVPVLGTTIGAIAGGVIGAGKGLYDQYKVPEVGQPVEDAHFSKPKNPMYSKGRQIIQDGVATPITNKDMFVGQPGGAIDKANKANQGANIPANVNHTFDTIEIKGSIMLETPGNPGKGVDLLKDAHFIRQITSLIHVETKRSMNQKQ
jgi:hypothetical protein